MRTRPTPRTWYKAPRGMARLRLTPQKREFFDLYASASANAVEIARLLSELLDTFP